MSLYDFSFEDLEDAPVFDPTVRVADWEGYPVYMVKSADQPASGTIRTKVSPKSNACKVTLYVYKEVDESEASEWVQIGDGETYCFGNLADIMKGAPVGKPRGGMLTREEFKMRNGEAGTKLVLDSTNAEFLEAKALLGR